MRSPAWLLIASLLLASCSRAPAKARATPAMSADAVTDGQEYFCLTPAELAKKSKSSDSADLEAVALHYGACMIDYKAALPWYQRLARRGDKHAIEAVAYYREHHLDRQPIPGRSWP